MAVIELMELVVVVSMAQVKQDNSKEKLVVNLHCNSD